LATWAIVENCPSSLRSGTVAPQPEAQAEELKKPGRTSVQPGLLFLETPIPIFQKPID